MTSRSYPKIGLIAFIGFAYLANAQDYNFLNYADPAIHPYADPAVGREAHRYADAKVNELRLYDFYSRQADYYIQQGELPEIIPAYPGMDAGINSHWGTHPQVHHLDDRWSRMDNGFAVGSVMPQGVGFIVKPVHVRLGDDSSLFATFDAQSLSYRLVWEGDFLRYPNRRWGITGLVEPGGEALLESTAVGWNSIDGLGSELVAVGAHYQGYYDVGNQTVFKYRVHSTEILDNPGMLNTVGGPVFTRTLQFGDGFLGLEMSSFALSDGARQLETRFPDGIAGIAFKTAKGVMGIAAKSSVGVEGIEVREGKDGFLKIVIPPNQAGATLTIYAWNSDLDPIEAASAIRQDERESPFSLIQGDPRRSADVITLPGKRGIDGNGDPYVIDTIPVPFENPYGSPMFLTGLDFFENGDAAVSTFFGDVWIVRGLDHDLGEVTWKRVAKGLNQPLGLLVIDGKIHTLGKDQITVLHDLNGDEVADFYENFCNAYVTSPGSHDYNTGFQRDDAGYLYFATKHAGVIQVSPDGKTVRSLGAGLRNPNGIGVAPDGRVWCSPQEGQWTPASQIVRIEPDGYYGFQKHIDNKEITPATAYIPRGIDNSSGGSVYITSDRWGPMKDKLVAFSFGASTHYLVLEDTSHTRPQGAIVPLKGNFLSGVHRARVHPVDGQVYAVGSQGWMNYAIQDGSFERVRYTGDPVYYPSGFQVFDNGIRVDFNETLATGAVEDPKRHFAQQWQYLYSMGYGSPEFSIRNPGTVGHDPLPIASTMVTNEGKSLFLEIPELAPAMTVHLRLHLEFAEGNPFATDLFATVHELGKPFAGLSNPQPIVSGKPHSLHLPIREAPEAPDVEPGSDEPGRAIQLKAITGLKYDQEKIVVRAGERISLTLLNTDEMPHNWVLTGWFTYELVGQLADALVADPTAAERHYIPDDPSVLLHSRVLNPGESHTIHFNAPAAPGKYPFLCTFPGHWQSMKGTLVVY
jgi:azurin/glucose/arabinose dehydrogenase